MELLVVDPAFSFPELLPRLLPQMRIRHVRGAEEALEAVLSRRPAVVIIDENLPGQSGTWLLARLREVIAGVPAILTSVTPEDERLLDVLDELGVDWFQPKPYALYELVEMVSELVRQRGSDR